MVRPLQRGLAILAVVSMTVVGTSPALAVAPDTSLHEVAPWGTDRAACAGGTPGDPWRTLEHSFRCLRPGDVLLVRGGTYDERVHTMQGVTPGTSAAPVLVAAYPGEQPVVRGYVRITAPDHWTVVGLDITSDAAPYAGGEYLLKLRGGAHWTWAHSEIHDVHAYAAMRAVPAPERPDPAPSNWRFLRNCVHDTHPTHDLTKDHNLYIATGRGAGPGLIEGNVIFNALAGENIKLGDDFGGAENVTVRYNTLHRAAQNILLFGPSANNTVERNVIGPVAGRAKSWYPNVRGFNLSGRGNVARDNIGFGASQFLFTGNDSGSSAAIADGGRNRIVDPQFSRTGTCGGYHPRNAAAAQHGARALFGTSFAGVPLLGDWDGDGVQTPGWYDDGRVALRNSSTTGHAEVEFVYGRAGDLPLVGDWDGDGIDTIGIVRAGGQWHLRNSHAGGAADEVFTYGRVGARGEDVPLVGDWDGDGRDTIGIVRDGQWHLRHTLSGGPGQEVFTYGRIGPRGDDLALVGDWDGDGLDTVGIVRDGEWHLRNTLSGGPGETVFTYGRVTRGDIPLTGDVTGKGTDTPTILRESVLWFQRKQNTGGTADRAFVYAGT